MGNEIQDRLAKTAAEVEEEMSEETTPETHLDIRNAVRTSCLVKLWKRLDAGNKDRHTYNIKPSVTSQSKPIANIQDRKV